MTVPRSRPRTPVALGLTGPNPRSTLVLRLGRETGPLNVGEGAPHFLLPFAVCRL
jgi:hypothetical protein